jgi:hypothetical protein
MTYFGSGNGYTGLEISGWQIVILACLIVCSGVHRNWHQRSMATRYSKRLAVLTAVQCRPSITVNFVKPTGDTAV